MAGENPGTVTKTITMSPEEQIALQRVVNTEEGCLIIKSLFDALLNGGSESFYKSAVEFANTFFKDDPALGKAFMAVLINKFTE
jgi:hypothetical protein